MQLKDIDWLCKVLACSRSRAYELIRRGWIPAIRIGRQIRIEETAVRDFIQRGGRRLRPSEAPNSSPGAQVPDDPDPEVRDGDA
jgi:excisionase family DNA binding protein